MTQSYPNSNFKDAYWSTKPITSEIEPDWIESICPIREQSEQRGWDLGLGFNIQRQLKIFGFCNLVKIHAKSIFDSNTYSIDYDNGWQL